MFDYATAERCYSGRVDPHVGRRIQPYLWMTYDTTRDCYVFNEVRSKHARRNGVYVKVPKSEWELRPIVEIYRDRVAVLKCAHNNYLYYFDLSHRKPSTNKFDGREWGYRGKVVHGNPPIVLTATTITVHGKPGVRTVNDEIKETVIKEIKRVRRLLKTRIKLGVFDGLEYADVARRSAKFRKNIGIANGKDLFKNIQRVDENNLESFFPIIHAGTGGWRIPRNSLCKQFDALINRMREDMYLATGAITYVVPD